MTIPWPPPVEYWRPLIEAVAVRYQMDPALIAAVIWQESRGDPEAYRYEPHLGIASVGLMQIAAFDWRPAEDELHNPEFNVRYGVRLLKTILRMASGDVRLALAAYNCSFEGVAANKCGRWGGLHYADVVLESCRDFGGCAWPTPLERRR